MFQLANIGWRIIAASLCFRRKDFIWCGAPPCRGRAGEIVNPPLSRNRVNISGAGDIDGAVGSDAEGIAAVRGASYRIVQATPISDGKKVTGNGSIVLADGQIVGLVVLEGVSNGGTLGTVGDIVSANR